MNIAAKPSFIRDAQKALRSVQMELEAVIHIINLATALQDIAKVKKLKGATNAYRIRIQDYRLGFFLEQETIVLARLLPRKEIYKQFP